MAVDRKPAAKRAPRLQKAKTESYIERTAVADTKPAEPASAHEGGRARRKHRVVRVPLSTRIPLDLRDRMDDFEAETGTGVQAMVEQALTEYLDRHERERSGPK